MHKYPQVNIAYRHKIHTGVFVRDDVSQRDVDIQVNKLDACPVAVGIDDGYWHWSRSFRMEDGGHQW
jgi:hypothetical protein